MNRLGSIVFWFGCLASPVLILVVLSIWGGVYPFGPESFLTEDLKYQYIDLFAWFRHVLTGEANIFYSFAQDMGSNAWGLYSYYLASPFNLIIPLFDEVHLTLAIYVIVALKLACMNTAMAWRLWRRFSLQRSWVLALALCHTWSTWTATNLRNPPAARCADPAATHGLGFPPTPSHGAHRRPFALHCRRCHHLLVHGLYHVALLLPVRTVRTCRHGLR